MVLEISNDCLHCAQPSHSNIPCMGDLPVIRNVRVSVTFSGNVRNNRKKDNISIISEIRDYFVPVSARRTGFCAQYPSPTKTTSCILTEGT